MNHQRRAFRPSQIRVADDGSRTFEAVVMQYATLDDYQTVFDSGCFTESLKARLPRITWSHDWSDPLGRYVDYVDTAETLTLIGEFDDFDAVPRARQAYAQLQSGTIDQFSVGFSDVSTRLEDEVVHFVKATLDEAALVLVGAVPGTKLVSVRSALGAKREVDVETLAAIAKKKAAGELTDDEAQEMLTLASGVNVTADPATGDLVETVSDTEAAALLAEGDAVLDQLG